MSSNEVNGHGGKRAGSGRKPKVRSPTPPVTVEAEEETPEQALALARRFSTVAVKVLVQIATKQDGRESARVAAAAKIIELARSASDDPDQDRESEISRRAIAIMQKERLN